MRGPGCPMVLNVTHRAASATRRHSLCSGGRADRLACMPNGAQPSQGRGQPLLMPAPWRSALRKTPPPGMDRWRRSPWREGGRIGARLAGVIAPTPNQPSAAGNLTHQACHAPPSRASRHSAGGETVTQTRPQPPYGTLFLLLELQDGADLEIDRWLIPRAQRAGRSLVAFGGVLTDEVGDVLRPGAAAPQCQRLAPIPPPSSTCIARLRVTPMANDVLSASNRSLSMPMLLPSVASVATIAIRTGCPLERAPVRCHAPEV
jgi:hypothetical protein